MTPLNPTSDRDPILWKKAKARIGFRMHLRSYLIINAGLWLIYLFTCLAVGSFTHFQFLFPWPVFSMIGWGIGLASHYFTVYHADTSGRSIEQEYQRLLTAQHR